MTLKTTATAADLAILGHAANPDQPLSGECAVCGEDALPGIFVGFELCERHMNDNGVFAARRIALETLL